MQKIIITTALVILGFTAHVFAAGSIQSLGTFENKKLVTKLDHEILRASSDWKMGNGEPSIGPGKAAQLAIAGQKTQFPDFKDSAVREVVDMDAVAEAGGRLKPNQMNYYVLLNSTVIKPEIKD